MTAQPPDLPRQQINTGGGVGFLGGVHSHHYGDYQAGAASQASRQATSQGVVLGKPISGQDPAALGGHASITVHDETTLVPYLARDHDERLRETLQQAATSDRAPFVLVVGTSCAGKTRTLYEAALKVLPDWQVAAPTSDSDLARTLTEGVPARTLVWLDELQDRLPATPSGITAAKAITELLTDDDVGPIVFAGTLWPLYRDAMRNRPDPNKTAAGAGAIPKLLARAALISVPEVFTPTDLAKAIVDDPRLLLAIDTATHTNHPDGRKITQVLAGGTQLLQRLHPAGVPPPDVFSPAAKALLHAAGDLRRIGMPNPLPRWALEGATPGYLEPQDHRPVDQWLPAAFTETTDADDPVTRSYIRDHYAQGVPALTPHWTTGTDGEPVEAYDLHDYLIQDPLTRHRHTPTQPTLWTTLTTRPLPVDIAVGIAWNATERALLTTAITLLRPLGDKGNAMAQQPLAAALAHRGDDEAVKELRARASAGDLFAQGEISRLLANRGDDEAVNELRARTNAGESMAEVWLGLCLGGRGDTEASKELAARRARQEANQEQPNALTEPLPNSHDAGYAWRIRLVGFLVRDGTPEAIARLRALADNGDELAQGGLTVLLARQGDPVALESMRAQADIGGRYAREFASLLADRAGHDDDSLTELRDRAAKGDGWARIELIGVLGRGDDDSLTELRALADNGDRAARKHLALILSSRNSGETLVQLRLCVLSGFGGIELLTALRRRDRSRHLLELDTNACAIYED